MPEYLTVEAVAKRHGSSRDAARQFLARWEVPLFRPSRRRCLVRLDDLERAERLATRPDSNPVKAALAALPGR